MGWRGRKGRSGRVAAGPSRGGRVWGRSAHVRQCLEAHAVGSVTHHPQPPIQQADEHLHRRTRHAEGILGAEEGGAEGDVGEEGDGEGGSRKGEAEDGEVLQVPAVRVVDGVGVLHEVGEGVGEGGEAERLLVESQ